MEANDSVIRLIDEEIARLQAFKRDLLANSNGSHKSQPSDRVKHEAIKRVARDGKTREGQLLEFLRVNGPSTSKQILEGTGMPRGSITYTITRAGDQIQRLEDGRYAIKR